MTVTAEEIWQDIQQIREKAPLVHNITNYVVMNTTANALLAIGASPVMAHAVEEVEQMAAIAASLVINIGTLSAPWVKAMAAAMKVAGDKDIPIILDPVGVGATAYRTQTAAQLLATAAPAVIRGNASEIIALVVSGAQTKGVDATAAAENAMTAGQTLHQTTGSTVCISGETDYIIGSETVASIANGHPLMPKVTGLGCTATALCGAFAAVNPSAWQATAHAMATMGIAGEMAAESANGPATFQTAFLDSLYQLKAEDVARRLKVGRV
ncbi:MAG: hydroxyethylthiazole kinase [Desulfobacterales bacterium]|nr:hydroxyethylthiazole kinase [Desulfobacterales bacterium]